MGVEKIIIGRDKKDLKDFGSKGTGFLGKHIVGSGEETHLTNDIHIDLIKPHVVLCCGKRGTGKSYTGGIISEEIALLPKEIKNNLAVLMIDTMGIYWSMKNPNEKDKDVLKEWKLKPKAIDIELFVPQKFVKEYNEVEIKANPFLLPTGELTALDWIITFGFSPIDPHGIALERNIKKVKDKYGDNYAIDDIVKTIQVDKKVEASVRDALTNRFEAAKEWGLFEKKGTSIDTLFKPGVVSVIDVSHYMRVSGVWSIRGVLVGLLARKIFMKRLMSRKAEEFEKITGEKKKRIPMVWIVIDEAHQFIPNEGITAATEPLLTLIKEGREPGISLFMITQRPGRLHEDALAQSDLIISHRLTSRRDIEALRGIMQTYVMEDIQELINNLPRQKGTALVLDDNSERLYGIQVRPRLSWHAGGSPSAIKPKSLFDKDEEEDDDEDE